MKTGIYMIRNKVNNKKYIGQAVDIDKRWSEHINELDNNQKYCNPHLQNAWNKYGADNFEFTIICQCLEQDLDRLEIHYIAHFDTYNNGYNLTLGGEGARGYKYTDEQRARRSEQNKEIMNRPEVKAKISRALKGKSTGPKSEEHKAKISEAMKEENKKRWSDPEYRAKMVEAQNRPEVKKKRSEAKRKAVYCVTNDTIYASTVEAEEKLNVPGGGGTVSWACKGKYEWGNGHVYKKLGLEFWYLDEYEEKFGKVAM